MKTYVLFNGFNMNAVDKWSLIRESVAICEKGLLSAENQQVGNMFPQKEYCPRAGSGASHRLQYICCFFFLILRAVVTYLQKVAR